VARKILSGGDTPPAILDRRTEASYRQPPDGRQLSPGTHRAKAGILCRQVAPKPLPRKAGEAMRMSAIGYDTQSGGRL
jgi:hypothetical protein